MENNNINNNNNNNLSINKNKNISPNNINSTYDINNFLNNLNKMDNNKPKFNLTPVVNIDIDELGDKINNFKVVDNSITSSLNSNNSNKNNNNNNNNINNNNNNNNNNKNNNDNNNDNNINTSSGYNLNSSYSNSSNYNLNSSLNNSLNNNNLNNSSNNNNNNNDNVLLNSSLNSLGNSSNDSTSPTLSSSQKSKRRFSLYVYQHPTDEQKKHISELYGYKEHHTNDHGGYKYTHESGIENEESSSDSYSHHDNTSKRNSNNSLSSSQTTNNSNSSITPPPNKATFTQTIIPLQIEQNSNNLKLSPQQLLPIQPQQQQEEVIPTTTTTTLTQTPTTTTITTNINTNTNTPTSTNTNTPTSTNNNNNNNNNLKDEMLVKVLEPTNLDLSQIPQSYFSTNYKSTTINNYSKPSQYLDDEYDEKKAASQPVQPPLSTAKDWNAEFQNLVYNEKIEGYRELSKLAHDFVYTAKIYGKVIISELTLPLHLKTIKPINIGGVAGGHKYIALGILFKLALDTQGLYVGDQNAMKAAGHELKGLMSYYNCRVEGLHHPLMALIDYRGYRLVAMSLLPINSDTIVYGSSDGGISVHNTNEEFNKKMIDSARLLNIKGHMVGKDIQKKLYSCGDIEGHIGSDDKFYLLDFARVFPPQMKLFDKGPPTHLFELIRPELVKSNSTPLSSDALTGWGKFDPLAIEHNNEVKEASFRLFLKVIPDLASYLNHIEMDRREIHLTQEIHRVGVNCRHLGLVRRKVKCKSVRKFLLDEIMARTMKSEIMALFRSKMKTADTPSEEPFKEVVVSYLNSVFKYEDTPEGRVWPKSLKKAIEKKFFGTFQINDSSLNQITFEQIQGRKFDEDAIKRYIKGASYTEIEPMYVDSVDIQEVMKRFNQLTGVGLTSRALREITKNDGIRLVQSDVKRMKAKVKAHHLVEFAEGMVLWDEAKKEKSRENIEGAFCPCPVQLMNGINNDADRITDRLFGLADEHFRSALSVSPHSAEVSANWAMMLMERARMSRECVPQEADLYYNAAEERVRACLSDGGKPKIALENVLLEYSEFLCIWGTTTDQTLDLSEANGLKSKVFSRASKKLNECVKLNPSKFALVLQKSKILDNIFHQSSYFKQSAAVYAAVCTLCDCLIQSFKNIPKEYYYEIAQVVVQNLNPVDLMKKDPEASGNPIIAENFFEKIRVANDIPIKNVISMRKDESEIQRLLEENPLEILKAEMGVMYLRYGYTSHVYGIQCSKRPHTKMASIKLFNKTGGLFQRGIDMDSYNKEYMLDHIKKFTSSSQFVEFYQSIIGCPCIMEFVKDRLSRIAHMSLKDCNHLSIEFVEGVIELSQRVKMLVLDGCTQITNDTIKLIIKKLPHLETLSLAGCQNISIIIPNSTLKEYQFERQQQNQHNEKEKCEIKICSLFDKSSSFNSSLSNSGSNNSHHHHHHSGLSQSSSSSSGLSHHHSSGSNSIGHSAGSTIGANLNGTTSSPHRHSISASINLNLPASLNGILSSTSPVNSLSLSASSSLDSLLKPFTFLQNLNLNGCKAINDHQLSNIAQMQLPLVNVYLKRCGITDLSLIQLVQNCPKLSILELSDTNITDQSINAIAINSISLKELHLDRCVNINFSSIEKLVRIIHDIRLLSLSDCPLAANDNTLRLIGKYCSGIQYLTLSRNTTITDSGMVSMSKHTVNLLELNISQCTNLTDQSINQISISCPKIRVLKMVGLNNITTLKPIGSHCTEMVYLDISECHKISNGLGSIAKGCSKLTTFKLRRCYGFKDASLISDDGDLHLMQRLTVLDWSHVNIEFNAIHSVSHSCQFLTALNISYCKGLNDNALERIANSLVNIKKLKFDGIINITDDGIKSLSDGPIYNNIEVLSMVGCRKISDISAYHILRFHNLRKLSIGGSLMTTNGADLIASSAFELVKIHVRNCLNINTNHLMEHHPHILIDTTQKDYNVFC